MERQNDDCNAQQEDEKWKYPKYDEHAFFTARLYAKIPPEPACKLDHYRNEFSIDFRKLLKFSYLDWTPTNNSLSLGTIWIWFCESLSISLLTKLESWWGKRENLSSKLKNSRKNLTRMCFSHICRPNTWISHHSLSENILQLKFFLATHLKLSKIFLSAEQEEKRTTPNMKRRMTKVKWSRLDIRQQRMPQF